MSFALEARNNPAIFANLGLAAILPFCAVVMTWDIALGRWLAFCAHPVRAWHRRSTKARALIVTSYFAGAYVTVLTALALIS